VLFFRSFKTIDPKQAREMMARDRPLLIDMRSTEAYNQGHLDGAVLGNKKNWSDFVDKLDKTRPVICYCYKGFSSLMYCKKLKKAGFSKVYNLKGGFDGWKP